MRRVIAQRLSASMFTAPHYYLMLPIRADNLMQDRKTTVNAKGGKVSLNAYLMKFVAEALKKHPRLNSSWRDDAIFHFDSIDIGLAVALPDGLVTPVVRDCGAKGILEIDAEIGEMIPRALTGTLLPEEYSNAGFTISNLGSFGIEEFTAIINPPGSAILAVGAFVREVVVEEEDSISLQTRFHATLSCDHRVVDGAVGAAFLKYLRNLIEEPIRALR
jgi:pyruvate dehydrogenase E2 component (dihydrolipoamide acetyltransferase)